MVVPDGEAAGDAFGETPEIFVQPLADRLERLEAGGARCGVDADAFGGAMIHRDEHRRLAFAGNRAGQVGAPHRIDGAGNDAALMAARAAW